MVAVDQADGSGHAVSAGLLLIETNVIVDGRLASIDHVMFELLIVICVRTGRLDRVVGICQIIPLLDATLNDLIPVKLLKILGIVPTRLLEFGNSSFCTRHADTVTANQLLTLASLPHQVLLTHDAHHKLV